jgi:hypothetical protein
VNNFEIIFENIKRHDLNSIIFKEICFDKQKIISSHFYDQIENCDIEFGMISSLEDFFAIPGTGNLYISEVDVGMSIRKVMIVISFDEIYGDVVLNFSESELFQENMNINQDCVFLIKKLQSIVSIYDIGSITVGYEPASDEDMQLVSFTKQGIKIFEDNFSSIMNDFKKVIYSVQ